MKKILSTIASLGVAALLAIGSTVSVFAETSTASVDIKDAIEAKEWGQTISIGFKNFDSSRMTKDSEIIITYTLKDKVEVEPDEDGNEPEPTSPIELVFQSWESPDTPMAKEDGTVWAKVAPKEFTESQATFAYDDIVAAYGTNNFDLVSALVVGATDVGTIKCTSFEVTNCNEKGNHTIDKTKESGNNLFLIIGIAAGVIIAGAILFFVLSRKSSKAFDVKTGKFIEKNRIKKK